MKFWNIPAVFIEQFKEDIETLFSTLVTISKEIYVVLAELLEVIFKLVVCAISTSILLLILSVLPVISIYSIIHQVYNDITKAETRLAQIKSKSNEVLVIYLKNLLIRKMLGIRPDIYNKLISEITLELNLRKQKEINR